MMGWDVNSIIDAAGGAGQLRRLLARADQEIPDNAAISMWKARHRLPSAWTAPVLYVLLKRDPNLDVLGLMVDLPRPEAGDLLWRGSRMKTESGKKA